jgi:hypothetical protein
MFCAVLHEQGRRMLSQLHGYITHYSSFFDLILFDKILIFVAFGTIGLSIYYLSRAICIPDLRATREKIFAEQEQTLGHYVEHYFGHYKIIFFLMVILVLSCWYFGNFDEWFFFRDFFYLIIIPLGILVLADSYFMIQTLPTIRQFVYKVNYYREDFNRNVLFGTQKEYIPLLENSNPEKIFLFRTSTIYQTQNTRGLNMLLTKVANYLWTVELEKQGQIKEYLYLVILVLIFVLYFLSFYQLYFVIFTQTFFGVGTKSFYSLIFLIIWTLYVIYRLKSISGTSYYQSQSAKTWNKELTEFQSCATELTVYELRREQETFICEKEYTVAQLLNDIQYNKRNDTTLEQVINIATAVIAMMIMQYIT